jgi:Domain of unknown function (DUF4160)
MNPASWVSCLSYLNFARLLAKWCVGDSWERLMGSTSARSAQTLLSSLCDEIDRAEKAAEEERKRAQFGDSIPIELLLARFEKTRVEIRQETAPHKEPHIHVTHSDKIDASLSLKDFRVLAGTIDRRSLKHITQALRPKQSALMVVWKALEKGDGVSAEKLISSLAL